MKFRHATLARNLRSIRRNGLLAGYSRGKMRAVWLHLPGMSEWAALHTVRRHGGRVEDVVVIELELPADGPRRFTGGLHYSTSDIPPECIRRVIDFSELSASPVGG